MKILNSKYHCFLALAIGCLFNLPVLAQQYKVLLYNSPDRWHDVTIPIAVEQFWELALMYDFELTWSQSSDRERTKGMFSEPFLRKNCW